MMMMPGVPTQTQGTDQISLHALKSSEGKPEILFLHGWPGFSYDWRKVVPLLPERSAWIAPDLRGFGRSGKPRGEVSLYGLDRHVADMIQVIDQQCTREVLVVAHDIGATIAQALATQHPGRVKAMVLLNPPYPGIGERRFEPSAQKEFWYQHFHQLPWAADLVGHDRKTLELYLGHFLKHWSAGFGALSPSEFKRIIDEYERPGAFEASIQYYRARAGSKAPGATATQPAKITQPTRILWSEADPVIPVRWSDRLGDHFSDFQLRTLPDVGHFVPWEAPDEVLKEIRALM